MRPSRVSEQGLQAAGLDTGHRLVARECMAAIVKPEVLDARAAHGAHEGDAERARKAEEQARESPLRIGGRSGPARPKTLVTWLAFLLGLRRWLAQASDPNTSPILSAPVSENAKRVYIYLAGIVYAFGSSHSRLETIAKSTGLSRGAARKAITELEKRRLLSHRARKTWHGRGAHNYRVRRVR
ncbi:helix-turn-helix domain-containing protein [Candidatus Binatus sp.]|uniref:helix-turn-helix domain-containing protein n=1 Tax=Candidatus Binatus sp. TaxID=2811406 RepID=UPI003C87F831